jgi:hypothetical protein
MKLALAGMLALVVVAGGCSGMQVQPGRQSGVPGTGADPGVGGSGGNPRSPGGTPGSGSATICRIQSIPRGWVAVDYVPSPNCPPLSGAKESGPNSALLTRYALLPPETILTVCADQRMPTDWSREPTEPADAASGRCPRRPDDTRTGPTVVRIRRVR